MDDTKKLLPCPFCGGEADIYAKDIIVFDKCKTGYSVYCKNCCCTTQYEDNKDKAIRDWNKRV